MKIKLTLNTLRHNGKIFKKGEEIEVDEILGNKLLKAGNEKISSKVKIKEENNLILKVKETVLNPEDNKSDLKEEYVDITNDDGETENIDKEKKEETENEDSGNTIEEPAKVPQPAKSGRGKS